MQYGPELGFCSPVVMNKGGRGFSNCANKMLPAERRRSLISLPEFGFPCVSKQPEQQEQKPPVDVNTVRMTKVTNAYLSTEKDGQALPMVESAYQTTFSDFSSKFATSKVNMAAAFRRRLTNPKDPQQKSRQEEQISALRGTSRFRRTEQPLSNPATKQLQYQRRQVIESTSMNETDFNDSDCDSSFGSGHAAQHDRIVSYSTFFDMCDQPSDEDYGCESDPIVDSDLRHKRRALSGTRVRKMPAHSSARIMRRYGPCREPCHQKGLAQIMTAPFPNNVPMYPNNVPMYPNMSPHHPCLAAAPSQFGYQPFPPPVRQPGEAFGNTSALSPIASRSLLTCSKDFQKHFPNVYIGLCKGLIDVSRLIQHEVVIPIKEEIELHKNSIRSRRAIVGTLSETLWRHLHGKFPDPAIAPSLVKKVAEYFYSKIEICIQQAEDERSFLQWVFRFDVENTMDVRVCTSLNYGYNSAIANIEGCANVRRRKGDCFSILIPDTITMELNVVIKALFINGGQLIEINDDPMFIDRVQGSENKFARSFFNNYC